MKLSCRLVTFISVAVSLLCMISALVEAATAGPRSASSTANSNISWNSPSNAFASDNLRATYGGGSTSQYLVLSGFGFGLPTTAIIDGITVSIEGFVNSWTQAYREIRVGLVKSGNTTLAGAEKANVRLPQSESTILAGGPTDLFGTAWTAAEINGAGFGVRIGDDDTTATTINIDHVTITVEYHLPPCDPTGSLGITPGQTVYGNPVDLTAITATSNATNIQYLVTTSAGGASYSQTDTFGTASGNFGNWTGTDTNTSGSGNWTLDNNATPSSNVGPTADQSGAGYYVYSEASQGTYPETYWLTSNSLDNASYALGLDFYWHMNHNGTTTCQLHVDASSDNGQTWNYPDLWQRTGDAGNIWNQQSVSLSAITPTGTGPHADKIKVRFRVVASGWPCDVGLDTIKISGNARMAPLFSGTATQAQSVNTSGWTNGASYFLTLAGDDSTCGTPLPSTSEPFLFNSCNETSPSGVLMGAFSNPVIGKVNINAALVDAANAQYRIDNGPWVSIGTPWDSATTHPGSKDQAVSNVKVQVRAVENECTRFIYDTPVYVTVDNTCVDTTPSTLTVKVGQTVSGSTVNLSSLYTATGSVVTDGAFTYQINGAAKTTPYDSSGLGTVSPEVVKLEVFGRDTTCGDKEVYGYGFVTIDNTCTRAGPTLSFDRSEKYVKAGGFVEYLVRIYNHDSPACPDESFDLSISSLDGADFISAFTGATTLVIPSGTSATTTLRVSSQSPATPDWTANTTSVRLADTAASRADLPADQTATTSIYAANPLLHNSITTKSNKHGGKWGTSEAGARYGQFTCSTCHGKGTGNIKRIRKDLVSPNPAQPFPIEGKGQVDFQEVTGLQSFGDDGRSIKTTTTYICEACHTPDASKSNGVNKHAYDMSALGNPGHFNQQDCTECHAHKTGFQASCDVCHGNEQAGTWWPDSAPAESYADRVGAHVPHVEHIGNFIASGNKNDGSATTMAVMNDTCVFCHPNPGGANKDGNMHISNTSGSDVTSADLFFDGSNGAVNGYFKYLDGSNDSNGFYDPSIKRCSNIDCHSNGQFTWAWYGDQIAPGEVLGLTAVTGEATGTVELSWTAPGNDNYTAGKAYRYEVRYSTMPIASEAAWQTATVAGGPPTSQWPGSTEQMTVSGLIPGTTYHLAVKAGDERNNWSVVSSSVSAVSKGDTVAPHFYGLESATTAYQDGAVNLKWGSATDTSKPITYQLWWTDSSTPIDYGPASVKATTTGLTYQVTGLTNGVNYYFAVRARDAAGNIDTNMVQKEAIPQQPAESEWTGGMYFARTVNNQACGSTSTWASGNTWTGELSSSGYLCTPGQGQTIRDFRGLNSTLRWTMPTPYAATMNITGGSFRINVEEQDENNDHSYSFRLGYTPDGASYTWFAPVNGIIPAGYRGYYTIGLAAISGQIPAGNRLAFEMTRTDSRTDRLDIRYASERYQSLLMIFEQVHNLRPDAFIVNTPTPGNPAGKITLSWDTAVDPDGDPVTYDVYASLDEGLSGYPILIVEDTPATSVTWDTLADRVGMEGAETKVRIKVSASDGLNHNEGGSWYASRDTFSGTFTVDNTADIVPPDAILDLRAEHRPKAGSVYLYWSAPGDDGMEGSAAGYDIRYSPSPIDSASFGSAASVTGEPVPGIPGMSQGYEVLGLVPEQLYFFAIKTVDNAGNWSTISNVPSSQGGPECGVCHSTPPDQAARLGSHPQHGYTQVDCAKCHGAESVSFTNDHADGVNKMGFNNPRKGFSNSVYGPVVQTATRVTYRIGGTEAGAVLYDDADGGGGYNDLDPGGGKVDNGSCAGFNASGVTGCHGAAGTDPDGAGPLPLYPAPVWGNPASISCAMCHGDQGRPNADPYGRPFEDGTHDTRYAGNVEIFKAAPPIDLRGNTASAAVGQHLRHLNFSYRFTGNSCTLCHMNNEHADGNVDVVLDPSAAGPGAVYLPGSGGNPGTCFGTSELRCHGDNVSNPPWSPRVQPEQRLVECSQCHGFAGKRYDIANNLSDIAHVTDGGQVRHCTHCHVEGHPREGFTISGISKGSPAVVTSARHGVHDGETVLLNVRGMTELNRWYGTVRVIDADTFSLDGVDSSGYGNFLGGYWKLAYPAKTVSAISKANPAVVTSAGHGLRTGDNVLFDVAGMLQLDGYDGPVTVIDADTFSLDGVDSTAYGTFTSGSWIKVDGTILVPNYSIGGIDYSSGGIHLKRVVNNRTSLKNGERIDTEAETCWGCHEDQSAPISEWGTNNKGVTGASAYDYGTLNQSSWIGATWKSPNFSYKTGTIQSTHSVNPDVTGPGLDTDDDLRCSYCHDVHDLNKATTDKVSGAPYLRGTWKGNPYNEDGAPGGYDADGINSAVYNYYAWNAAFGAVPRGTTQSQMGGYWIDQNSKFPTATWTLADSAGLCTMCHGSDVNNMNKFGNAGDDWIGQNGHSNAVIGGSGMYKFNVYNPNLRNEGNGAGVFSYNDPGMGYQQTPLQTAEEMYGLRNNDGSDLNGWTAPSTAANGRGVTPYIYSQTGADLGGDNARWAFGDFAWAVDRSTTTAEQQYHRFSCSKCHNPHASRLPRLMITNCLDVRHNRWDNVMATDGDWTNGSSDRNINWSAQGVMPYAGNDWTGAPRNRQFAYATSAQNCHRYIEDTPEDAETVNPQEPGWNKVTPWNE